MAEMTLQCQGLPCPQPVLRCKDIITKSRPDRLLIQVDNEAARENVSRFLASQQYVVHEVKEDTDGIELVAGPQDSGTALSSEEADQTIPASDGTAKAVQAEGETQAQLVFITSDVIGHGDDELGQKLMLNFIATLPEMGPSLWRILLLNSGVKLAIQGSPALEYLKAMEAKGVSILVCGTCLDFFNLLDHKQVGETTNMLDVVTSLQLADKVIKV